MVLFTSSRIFAQTTPSGNSFDFIDDSPKLNQTPSPQADNCNNSSSNACPFDNQPTKYIKMDMHFVCNENGSGNFNEFNDGVYPYPKAYNAYQRAEDLIKEANRQLEQNTTLNTKTPPAPPVCKLNIQLVLGDVIIHRVKNLVQDTKLNGVWNSSGSDNFVPFSSDNNSSYANYFYPMRVDPGSTGLGGYTYPGADQTVVYGNWDGYQKQKTTGDPWYFPSIAQTLLHEVFHTNGLKHPKDGDDGCDDTYQYPNVWDSGTNNLMDYHGNANWALSPCQICRIHSSLEGETGFHDHSNKVSYTGNCTRPSTTVSIPSEVCYNPFGNTLRLEGRACMYETSYDLGLVELDASGVPINSTRVTKAFTGEVGKIGVEKVLGVKVASNKTYRISLKVKNDCGEKEVIRDVKVKLCDERETDISISSLSKIRSVNIYPNPTYNNINVEYEVVENTNTKVEVISVQNPSLHFDVKSLSTDDRGDKYYFSEMPYEYPNGQYFIRLFSDENVITKSFFYQKD